MLKDELKKYEDLYAELVSHFVQVHNTHKNFVIFCGRETGYKTRKNLAKLTKISNQMRRQGLRVYRAQQAEERQRQALAREEKKNNRKK